jgi:hypothetical protein
MPPRRMRHLRGFDYRGRRSYALVLTTFGRQPHFRDREIVAPVLDQILQSEDIDVHEAVRYVMQNAVAAGLVRSADDYPFSADDRVVRPTV